MRNNLTHTPETIRLAFASRPTSRPLDVVSNDSVVDN
jgi:hypothetical protein